MTSDERRHIRYHRRQQKRLMKRIKRMEGCDSYESIFDYGNLYKSYKKCRKNVSWKGSVQRFISQAPLNVYTIWNRLNNRNWRFKKHYEFDILERGKVRHIKSVSIEERIVQKSLCDYSLIPTLSPTFIYDNSASLEGKGYHFAISRCEQHLRDHYRKHGSSGYVLVFDFTKFFDNINHKLIHEIIDKSFKDIDLKNLIKKIISSFGDIGLGLGSQISQILALASANRLDHYIKEIFQAHHYGRYMDDGYIIHPDKEVLKTFLKQIKTICNELGIIINDKKTQIVKLTHGFTFLKCRFYMTETGKIVKKIYKKSVTKARRKLKKLKKCTKRGL